MPHPINFTRSKGKDLPTTDFEGLKREYRYRSTLSVTSELDEGGWLTPLSGRYYVRERDLVPTV